mgnify:FL=1
MLIEAYAMRMSTDSAHEIATHICEVARDGVNIRPEELEPKKEEAVKDEQPAPAGAIPEGTVLGDGHIKYVLARVDTRLLHGQVATTWTKSTQPTRIIVVSDAVSQNITSTEVLITLVGFTLIYALLAVAAIFIALKFVKKDAHKMDDEGGQA